MGTRKFKAESKRLLEGFLAVATRWKESLEALVGGGEGEEIADSVRKDVGANILRV